MDERVPPSRVSRITFWCGGGSWTDIDDPLERSSYQSAGVLVLLNAALTWLVASVGIAGNVAGGYRPAALLAAAVPALLGALVVGVLGRTLASSRVASLGRRVATNVTGGLVALVVGIVVGELAALIVFAGPIELELAARPTGADTSAGAAGHWLPELNRLRADRAALDTTVANAITRRDAALEVARCEYRPSPSCPREFITGDPGRGPATARAEAALAGAESDVASARTARDRQAPAIDNAITSAQAQLAAQDATADRRGDGTGLGARLGALHSSLAHNPTDVPLYIAVLVLFVLFNLLPLIMRLHRGQTRQDHRAMARAIRDRADAEADAAIAVRSAELRAAQSLAAPAPAPELATAERIAAPEPLAVAEAVAAPKAVAAPMAVAPAPRALEIAAPAELVEQPAGSGKELVVKTASPLLDRLPGPLPALGRAVTGIVRPFVPAPVGRLVAAPAIAMRTARTLFEEVEEVRFVFQRKRTITTTSEDTEVDSAGEPDPSQLMQPQSMQRQSIQPQSVQPLEPVHEPVHGTIYRATTRRGALADRGRGALTEGGRGALADGGQPAALPPAEDDR